MKVSLDLHDFSVIHNRMDLLKTIKEHFPGFKVSLFTIPYDYLSEQSNARVFRDRFLHEIKQSLDWMQLIPHGLMHIPREFERCDRWTMKMAMEGIEEAFGKDGLPYEKGFCAPYWLWNQDVVDVMDESGWWGAVDRNQPEMLCPKRVYKYSHSLSERFYEAKTDTLKLHGHMGHPSDNALEDHLLSILKLPEDAEWHFVTDFVEEKK